MIQSKKINTFIFSTCVCSLVLGACSRPQIDTTEIIRPVRVMEIRESAANSQESYPGQVEPRYDAVLSFQVGGQMSQRLVEVGQRVSKGQVLARLDPKDLRLALDAARAGLQAAETEYAQTRTDLQRSVELKSQGFVSQAELDRRQLAFDAATSRLAQAKAQMSVQSNQNDYGTLRAPNEGVIASVQAETGQVLAPGQPVMVWANDKAAQVRLAVPETRVKDYQVGRTAKVKLWSSDRLLPGVIREVSPVADPMTRAYPVYLDLDPQASQQADVKFGMSATVYFEQRKSDSAVKIPVSAVVADGLGAFVWVFDEQAGTVQRRNILASTVASDGVIVDSGIQAGDLVVTAGTHVLIEGMKVKRFIESRDIEAALEEKRRQSASGSIADDPPGTQNQAPKAGD